MVCIVFPSASAAVDTEKGRNVKYDWEQDYFKESFEHNAVLLSDLIRLSLVGYKFCCFKTLYVTDI